MTTRRIPAKTQCSKSPKRGATVKIPSDYVEVADQMVLDLCRVYPRECLKSEGAGDSLRRLIAERNSLMVAIVLSQMGRRVEMVS